MATLEQIKKNDVDIYRAHNHGPMMAAVVVARLRRGEDVSLFVAENNRDDGRAPELKSITRLKMPHRGCLRHYGGGVESTLAGSIYGEADPLSEKEMLCGVAHLIGSLGPWVFKLDQE